MNREEVEGWVREMIARELGLPALPLPAKRIVDDLGADSLDMIELTIECEKHFKVDISDAAMDKVKTVDQLVDAVMDAGKATK